jgi:signal transduction histidine kinase
VSGEVQPWIFFLLNVITAATLLAFPLVWQVVLVFFVPIEWLVVRLVQSSGAPFDVPLFLLEASFALVLGSIVVTLGWLFRRVAATVDRRRAEADASYAEAIAVDAAEQERLAVGALMHDSVLSALIAAARGHSSRERQLAVSMASEALTRLADAEHDASMGPEGPVALVVIAQQLQRVADDLGVSITVPAPEGAAVPSAVARALALAGVQAITNAVEHAGGAGLEASISATREPLRVQVMVSDRGSGFDTSKVPDDRLGISASIMARMAAVRGRASVQSGRDGTTVTLSWTASEQVE